MNLKLLKARKSDRELLGGGQWPRGSGGGGGGFGLCFWSGPHRHRLGGAERIRLRAAIRRCL